MENKKWTKSWPTKPGYYWFYGYRYGKISCGRECDPELMIVEVRKTKGNDVCFIANGQFMYKSEVEEAHFQEAILPSTLPSLVDQKNVITN